MQNKVLSCATLIDDYTAVIPLKEHKIRENSDVPITNDVFH